MALIMKLGLCFISQGVCIIVSLKIVFMHIYTNDIIIDTAFVFTILERFTILYVVTISKALL